MNEAAEPDNDAVILKRRSLLGLKLVFFEIEGKVQMRKWTVVSFMKGVVARCRVR